MPALSWGAWLPVLTRTHAKSRQKKYQVGTWPVFDNATLFIKVCFRADIARIVFLSGCSLCVLCLRQMLLLVLSDLKVFGWQDLGRKLGGAYAKKTRVVCTRARGRCFESLPSD